MNQWQAPQLVVISAGGQARNGSLTNQKEGSVITNPFHYAGAMMVSVNIIKTYYGDLS